MRTNDWSGVKAVCFDLDGTLYPAASLRMRMARLLLWEFLGGRVSARELRVLRSFRKNRECIRRLAAVQNVDAYTVTMTAREHGCGDQTVAGIVDRWMFQAPLPVLAGRRDPRLRQMMKRLHLRGYRLGVFSDYPAKDKLEALGLPVTLFDAIVEAGQAEVDALKPQPQGFLELSRRLSLQPSEILYVGDRDSVDGQGARAVGMHFVLYSPHRPVAGNRAAIHDLLQLEGLLGACGGGIVPRAAEGCWLCGSTASVEFLPSRLPQQMTPELTKITGSHYGMTARLLQCSDCGFVRADAESARAMERLYEPMEDPEYAESSPGRRKAFSHLLERIRQLHPGARSLLDVGASTGAFCAEAEGFGLQAEGVEPSAWAVAQGRRLYGVTLHEGYFPHAALEGKQFDVVTMLDVIEHVSQPLELLRAARRCLSPQGLLVLITPDIGSFLARRMGARWWHLRPGHIGYFTRETMSAALGATGFILQAREPYTRWFPLSYLLVRLEAYLPIAALNRLANRWFTRVCQTNLPLTLRDDYIFFAAPIGGSA